MAYFQESTLLFSYFVELPCVICFLELLVTCTIFVAKMSSHCMYWSHSCCYFRELGPRCGYHYRGYRYRYWNMLQ